MLKEGPYIPEGMWQICPHCKQLILSEDLEPYKICPHCSYHFRIEAKERLDILADSNSFKPLFANLEIKNPLGYIGYQEKINQAKEKTGLDEAILTGQARIMNEDCLIGIMESKFLMASMGYGVGEKVTLLFEYGLSHKLPVVLVIASGGARMQEGSIALMQMAKTTQAMKKFQEAGNFYLALLTDPTMGGVSASFAMSADIVLAEEKARIGFAGPELVKKILHEKVDENFQTAEYQLSHGFIDQIIERAKQKEIIGKLLNWHKSRK